MKILFTLSLAHGFHGSVVHVKEISAYYASKGHECTVATIWYTPEIKKMFADVNVQLITIDEVPLETEYDILFGIHFPCVSSLLQKHVKIRKLVLNSLSFLDPIEVFPMYYASASMLMVYSRAARQTLVDKYHYPLESMRVFENSLPDEFVAHSKTQADSAEKIRPKNILVVSNHIPKEIRFLKKHLPGVKIKYFGRNTVNQRLITPKEFDGFDVIITIGKTVQYAMGAAIPVYEYDHFGGNGYITPENMATEAHFNFAGRNTLRKLSSEEIAKEILDGYGAAVENRYRLQELAVDRFLLSQNLDRLMEDIIASPDFDYESLKYVPYNLEIDFATSNVIETRIQRYEREKDKMYKSGSWKIFEPLRILRKLMRY